MRIYFSPEVTKFLSSITLVAAFGLFGFALWKAFDLWRGDATLQQIQELINQQGES